MFIFIYFILHNTDSLKGVSIATIDRYKVELDMQRVGVSLYGNKEKDKEVYDFWVVCECVW